MSLDLVLLVLDGDHPGLCYSHTLLRVMSDNSDLLDRIKAIRGKTPVPPYFHSYQACLMEGTDDECTGYGETPKDAYGHAVKCVTAAQLAKLAKHPGVTEYPFNRAIWAFLAAAPAHLRVALYWD